MHKLIIATRNAHKVEEIRAILGEGFRILTLNDFPDAPETVEDAGTFAGNATKKSLELAKFVSGLQIAADGLVLADDSGLEVDVLNGAPGVHSARFAALDTGQSTNSSNAANNAKLLRLLKDIPLDKRAARFRCVMALTPVVPQAKEQASPTCYAEEGELQTELFEGECEGRIDLGPRGDRGFGYDPLFIPAGQDLTFGELGDAVKNQVSHRAKALAKLKLRLGSNG